jgi:O-antigen/teichoic acid export membrane protein
MFGQGSQFAAEGTPTLRVVAIAVVFSSAGALWLNSVTGTGKSKITFLINWWPSFFTAFMFTWYGSTGSLHNLGLAVELLYWGIFWDFCLVCPAG